MGLLLLASPVVQGASLSIDASNANSVTISWGQFEFGLSVNGSPLTQEGMPVTAGTMTVQGGGPITISAGWYADSGNTGSTTIYLVDPGTAHIRNEVQTSYTFASGSPFGTAHLDLTFSSDGQTDLGTVPSERPTGATVISATGTQQEVTLQTGVPSNLRVYVTSAPPSSTLGNTGTSSNPTGATTTTVNQTTAAAVNTASGNEYITFSDLVVPGKGLRFSFIRSYNDQDSYSGPFGTGWTHSYNILLTTDGSGAVTIKEGDGHQNVFQPKTGGGYTAPAGVYDVLAGNGTSYTLTRPNQTVLAFGPPPLAPTLIRLLFITDKNSNQQALSYDANGNLTNFVDVGGGQYTFAYNGNHMTSMTDKVLNNTYSYTVGSTALASYTDPNSKTSQYTYVNNLLTVATDPVNNTAVSNTFDGQGRVLTTTRGGACPTTYAYDDTNHITTITDPNGGVTKHYHDSKQRLTQIVNVLDAVTMFKTTFTYDSNTNNLLSTTNPLGKITAYSYDSHGNRTSVTDPLGDVTTLVYDAKNNLVSETDPNGNVTTFGYDTAGNLSKVTDPLNGVTSFTYDAHGNKVGFTNANKNTTANTFGPGNRILTTIDPAGNRTVFTYDGDGHLATVREPANNTKTLGYDSLGRLTSVSYIPASTPRVTYTYDANGNRLTMTDASGKTTYSYDALNRVTSILFPSGSKVIYTYDCNDNRTSMSYSGKTVSYKYDLLNRMISVADGSNVTSYDYDAANNLKKITYSNGASVGYEYDAANRMTQVRNTGSGDDLVSSFAYILDKDGNRTQVTERSGSVTTFAYDKLNRLIGSSVDQKATNYTYDPVGNRISQNAPGSSLVYSYDFADQLLTAGSAKFHYDANGNQVLKTDSGGTVKYGYDAADRLISAEGSSVTASRFTYDGDGNRLTQTVGKGTYAYLNDISTPFTTVLAETGPDGPIQYVRGRSLISAAGPTALYYYHYDAQSTVTGLTDKVGHLAERYVYDIFGQLQQAVPNPGVGPQNKFGYTGEALDPGTSLYYLRSRYYDPSLGRFISKDSFLGSDRLPQSLNRFSYVRNNPATLTDRTGFCDDNPDLFFLWPCAPPLP